MNSSLLTNPNTILIIDDEEDICFMLSSMLQKRSYTPKAVHSIDEANKWLSHEQPLIIFLDNNLPDGKGIEYLPNLKKSLPHTKIIMITAYDTPEDRRIALENGADAFIGKPFTRLSIFSTIEHLVD